MQISMDLPLSSTYSHSLAATRIRNLCRNVPVPLFLPRVLRLDAGKHKNVKAPGED